MGDPQRCWLDSAKLLPHSGKILKYYCTRNLLLAKPSTILVPSAHLQSTLHIWRNRHIQMLHELSWFCPCWKDICLFINSYQYYLNCWVFSKYLFPIKCPKFCFTQVWPAEGKKLLSIKSFAMVRTTGFSAELFKAEKLQLRHVLQSFGNYKRGRKHTLPKTLLLKIFTNTKSHQFKGTIVLSAEEGNLFH